jgi:hypothetical protein
MAYELPHVNEMDCGLYIPTYDSADFQVWQTVTESSNLVSRKIAMDAFANNQYRVNLDCGIQNPLPVGKDAIRKVDWMGNQTDDITRGCGKFLRVVHTHGINISSNVIYAAQCPKDNSFSLYFTHCGSVYRTHTITEHNGIHNYKLIVSTDMQDDDNAQNESHKKYLHDVGCNTLRQLINNTAYIFDHKKRYGLDTKALIIMSDVFSDRCYKKNIISLPHILFNNQGPNQHHVVLAAFHPSQGVYAGKYVYLTLNEALIVLEKKPVGPELKYHLNIPIPSANMDMNSDIDDISSQMSNLLNINA